MSEIPVLKNYIHGKYVNSESGEFFENLNPATGKVISLVEIAGRAEVEKAVQSSEEGFQIWSSMSGTQRGRILNRAVQILRKRNEELAKLEVSDTGKPLSEAIEVDIHSGADAIEYYAGLAASLHGHHYDLGFSFAYTRREPLGITAGIGAWNYPFQIAAWKSGPALACGNSMIFKPAELSPITALKLAEVYTEAGVPDGVFNVVQGFADTGRLLSRHEKIAKISLTGEVNTGKKVMADAATSLKKVTLELGGKSPLIIFSDADLDNAVKAALMANFYTQGEVCSNGTRVFVEKAIHKEFAQKLVERTRKIKIGDPMDMSTTMGALISKDHYEKVMYYITKARENGSNIIFGGKRVQVPGHAGYFIEPAIIDDCTDNMQCVQEEIFGPVLSILPFETEEEVLKRANHTPYGLAAGVFTCDIQRAHRVVSKLQAGICWINNYNLTPIEIPFGGYKQSGLGRENSLATIEYYTQLKTVYVEMGDVTAAF
ncbi:MAG: betaine-aldehyde dehydrogenase [Leptospiraceae bacterium]|nr:betaine-aldehyde dehydrogenase [Leptospiraceae bacterium]MCP5500161.1 betaine-aldehyde dehydrogenase [Leptospiraceae bacterium]